MNILSIVIIAFIILELFNVLMLYFMPGAKKGNGVGVFNAYEKSKQDPDISAFVNYLVNWIAGTKLIFIALLMVVIIVGDDTIKLYSIVTLIISISSFFWRLFPAIKKMDEYDQITPKGYSKTLGIMIAGFVGFFIIALLIFLSTQTK